LRSYNENSTQAAEMTVQSTKSGRAAPYEGILWSCTLRILGFTGIRVPPPPTKAHVATFQVSMHKRALSTADKSRGGTIIAKLASKIERFLSATITLLCHVGDLPYWDVLC
jgi:hypothetical protein